MARAGDVPAGRSLRRRPGRRAFRPRVSLQRGRREGRKRGIPLRRRKKLRFRSPEPDVPPVPPELVRLHRLLSDPRPGRREHSRARPQERLSGAAVRPVSHPAPVGGAGFDRLDRLEVDPRFSLQRHQLGSRPAAPRQGVLGPDVAGRAEARDDVGHPRAHVAHAPVRDGHHPGRLDGDSERHPRGRGRGRSGLFPKDVPDRAPDDAPDHQRGGSLRRDLHLHRHDRDLHPDPRWALRHDASAAFDGVLHRNSGQRSRRRCRDFDLSGAAARRRRLADAPLGAPRGSDLMATGIRARQAAFRTFHWTVLAVFSILLAFPFYWMLITSFKRTGDLYDLRNNPFIFNQKPTLEHLRLLLRETLFLRWLGNTAFAGLVVVGITLLLAVPAAYALGLQDTLWAVIVVYPSFTIPFSTWLLMGFFKSIPPELEDAAMVDGLTRFQAFLKLVIPISVSGILTVVIFSFTLVTQEFVYALTFISSASHQTVGVGVP